MRLLPLALLLGIAQLLCGCSPFESGQAAVLPPDERNSVLTSREVAPASVEKFREINFRAQTGRVLVLMYHDAVEKRLPETLFYDVSADEFRDQMRFLKANGANVIDLDTLYRHLVDGAPVPPRSVVLTFDDNYQGVNDHCAPILKEFGFPFAVFVHTGFVGNTTVGRPKMTWDTLKTLVKDFDATVASHTVTHPQDISKLPAGEIYDELKESRIAIQQNLGIETPYLTWPGGNFDPFTLSVAESVGYRMAFAMESGLAEHSPGILQIRRYPFNKFKEGWDALLKEEAGGWGFAEAMLDFDRPVSLEEVLVDETRSVVAITGGKPKSVLIHGRQQVGDLIQQFGGVAGINGGFFADASIKSEKSQMLGPCVPENTGMFLDSYPIPNVEKLANRPLVMWDAERLCFVPYVHATMNEEYRLRQFMPDLTNAFLAGAWLVRDGRAFSKDQILAHGSTDAMEVRPRSFMGVRADGAMVLGASKNAIDSARLAEAAVALGCVHAVLLDSGYSTSLVFNQEVQASGHRTRDVKSRPIPHAIIVLGELALDATVPQKQNPRNSGS